MAATPGTTLQQNFKISRWNKAVRRFYCKTAGIKPPACRVIAFSWTGGFIATRRFYLAVFLRRFILNLAAVQVVAVAARFPPQ
jgi:hypothetical protein